MSRTPRSGYLLNRIIPSPIIYTFAMITFSLTFEARIIFYHFVPAANSKGVIGTVLDKGGPCIPVELLDEIFLGQAVAAEDLDRIIRHFIGRVGAKHLGNQGIFFSRGRRVLVEHVSGSAIASGEFHLTEHA